MIYKTFKSTNPLITRRVDNLLFFNVNVIFRKELFILLLMIYFIYKNYIYIEKKKIVRPHGWLFR